MAKHASDDIARIHRDLHSHLPSDPALRVKALETVLVEKGLLAPDAVDRWLDAYAENVGPMNGARIIARAWADAEFADLLGRDAIAAFKTIGVEHAGYDLRAVFNSDSVHNLVVCTLCSCYPLRLIGMSPGWYKSTEYRARAVRDPRGVLAEFGVTLPDGIELRVWDSTSERRYMVVPERPAGTEGMDAEALAELVTRDSMIGCGRARSPEAA